MQKKSRFLTGLLSAVMALTLFALPASAAAENAAPTIDFEKTGSLTIYKYEGSNPSNDKLLDGVTFTAYKVAEIKQEHVNGTVNVSYEPVQALKAVNSSIAITSKTTYDSIKDDVNSALAAEGENKLTAYGSATTGDSEKGKAIFNSMPLGIYLIVETDAPSQILEKDRTANFLVSIPMMNTDAENYGWNYSVEAKPKNTPTYGGITLVKYGKTVGEVGNGNPLEGATFILQHKNGDSWEKISSFDNLTVGGDSNQGSVDTDGVLSTGTDGKINIQGLAPGTYRFVERTAPNGYIVDGNKTYVFTVVDSTTVSVPNEITDKSYFKAEDKTITVVNEKPDLKKTALIGNDYGAATDAKLGDEVTWKVEVKVPSKVNELKTFTITDQMSKGLDKPEKSSFSIVTDKGDAVTLAESTDYELSIQDATSEEVGPMWVIKFTQTGKNKLTTNEITTVTVTFKTALNDKAVSGKVGNKNDAQLDYSNGFYSNSVDNGHPEPGEDTIKDQAIVFTFKFEAVKKDSDNQDKKLAGAEFDLYRYDGDKVDPSVSEITNGNNHIFSFKSDANGQLNIKDAGTYKDKLASLGKGTYYLIETKAPVDVDGKSYNLLAKPIKVDLNVNYNVEKSNPSVVTNGKKTTTTTIVEIETFDESKVANANITILNKKGFNLPTTGGFGTLLFSGIGALLVVGGVGVLMGTKKKKDNA